MSGISCPSPAFDLDEDARAIGAGTPVRVARRYLASGTTGCRLPTRPGPVRTVVHSGEDADQRYPRSSAEH